MQVLRAEAIFLEWNWQLAGDLCKRCTCSCVVCKWRWVRVLIGATISERPIHRPPSMQHECVKSSSPLRGFSSNANVEEYRSSAHCVLCVAAVMSALLPASTKQKCSCIAAVFVYWMATVLNSGIDACFLEGRNVIYTKQISTTITRWLTSSGNKNTSKQASFVPCVSEWTST